MKKISYITFLLVSVLTSCTKSKDNKPIIILNGNEEETVSLNSNYAELGAKATDNEDGDISSALVITGEVNSDLVGEYPITYNVVDSDGNDAITVTRNVKVANDAEYLVGQYVATHNCGATPVSDRSVDVTTSTVTNNKIFIQSIIIESFGDVFTGTVSGNDLDIPLQKFSTSGSGTIDGINFSINASNQYGYDCAIEYTRQ